MSINLSNPLLEAVFEAISSEIQFVEAVRNEDNVIIDFRYSTGTKTAYGNNHKLSGKSVLSLYPWKREIGLFDRFVNALEKDEPVDVTFKLQDNGIDKWYHILGKKFGNGLVICREDVTVRKEAEEKIMQLNKALFRKNRELEALSSELRTFNAIAANDYDQILKQVYNSMEFLVSNDAKNLSDAGKANIRRAQAAIQKMKLLTDDIVAFSGIHSDEQITPVDLNETLAVVLTGFEEKVKAENATVLSDKLPVITGYFPLISLLLYHLINNALKFRKEYVDVIIEIRHSIQDGADIEHSSAIADTNYHVISVIDNGIGFDPQEGEKIFTMFYRFHEKGKQKGPGIGLAICKKIMDLHGGFIVAECTPRCTTFRCYFPIYKN